MTPLRPGDRVLYVPLRQPGTVLAVEEWRSQVSVRLELDSGTLVECGPGYLAKLKED